jgi:hypothetical protein
MPMSLRSAVIFAALTLLLCGCLAESTNSAGTQEMERNHDQMILTTGGGGGGGGGGM